MPAQVGDSYNSCNLPFLQLRNTSSEFRFDVCTAVCSDEIHNLLIVEKNSILKI